MSLRPFLTIKNRYDERGLLLLLGMSSEKVRPLDYIGKNGRRTFTTSLKGFMTSLCVFLTLKSRCDGRDFYYCRACLNRPGH